ARERAESGNFRLRFSGLALKTILLRLESFTLAGHIGTELRNVNILARVFLAFLFCRKGAAFTHKSTPRGKGCGLARKITIQLLTNSHGGAAALQCFKAS